MPNWVTNRLTITADDDTLKRIIAEVRNGDKSFDFEKVIPMPENIYRGDLGPEERKTYGNNNWYYWSIANWGTKWNACQNEDGDIIEIFNGTLVYEFDTAWSAPYPVVQRLSEKYTCVCTLEYFDEDFGCNCGCYECVNGEVDTDIGFDGDDAAYTWLAATFGSETMEAHGYSLVNGKWEYIWE